MANLNQLKLFRNIHMRGIGGTSMSGIAEMLKHWGFHVTGSDDNSSELTDKLIDRGIPVTIGYDFNNLSVNITRCDNNDSKLKYSIKVEETTYNDCGCEEQVSGVSTKICK